MAGTAGAGALTADTRAGHGIQNEMIRSADNRDEDGERVEESDEQAECATAARQAHTPKQRQVEASPGVSGRKGECGDGEPDQEAVTKMQRRHRG